MHDSDILADEPPVATPPARLSNKHIVLGETPAGVTLVWLMTHRYANGDALGPVAFVERREHALVPRALGVLRAPASGATLRVVELPDGDATRELLIVEGHRCPTGDARDCAHEAQVLLRSGPSLIRAPFVDDAGECVQSSRVQLARAEVVELNDALARLFKSRAIFEYGEALTLVEQVDVIDFDPREPEHIPTPFRTITERRKIKIEDERLVVDEPLLWTRVLRNFASITPKSSES